MSAALAPGGETIVVLNAGSSSIKFAAFARSTDDTVDPLRILHGEIDGLGKEARLLAWRDDGQALPSGGLSGAVEAGQWYASELRMLFEWLEQQLPGRSLRAVAHRVVHGGTRFTKPVRVTAEVLKQLKRLCPLAPLHQPHNLAAIELIAALEPALPQFACFDTAFHADQPWEAQTYALPRRLRDAGVKRYGFHGLSYEYIASVLPAQLGALADQRVVVAHLGNGASMCALRNRRSVATSMGFTALDGLMMGTRCGSLDPGVVLYLAMELGMDAKAIEHMLYHESGLLGVSEISSDMRVLEASDDPRAKAAIDLFVHRIHRELGSLAAALGGLDALVFTAGIGEHSNLVRERVCRAAAWLGISLDEEANRAGARRISSAASRASAWVIPTNEELMLTRHAQDLLLQSC
jgi:acetate kinase